jgi:hypothetical protein
MAKHAIDRPHERRKVGPKQYELVKAISRLNRANKAYSAAVAELREATADYKKLIHGMIPPVPQV